MKLVRHCSLTNNVKKAFSKIRRHCTVYTHYVHAGVRLHPKVLMRVKYLYKILSIPLFLEYL